MLDIYQIVRNSNRRDLRHFGTDGFPMLVISTYSPTVGDVVNGWVFDLPAARANYISFNERIADQIRWLRSEYKLSDEHKFYFGATKHCSKAFVKLLDRWMKNHKTSPFVYREPLPSRKPQLLY